MQTNPSNVSQRPSTSPHRRPIGITIITVVNFVLAAAIVFLLFLLNAELPRGIHWTEMLMVAISIVITLGITIGLWCLQEWARMTAIILYSISLGVGIILFLLDPPGQPLGLSVPAIIIWYLTRPNVRLYFDKHASFDVEKE
ncbi:MAG: hypothetical protein AAGF95_06715 [Chloroflexota bacterium]